MGGKIKLAHHKVWRPAGDGTKLNIGEIENHVLSKDARFGSPIRYLSDPWQARTYSASPLSR